MIWTAAAGRSRDTVLACHWHVTALSGQLLQKLIADTVLVERSSTMTGNQEPSFAKLAVTPTYALQAEMLEAAACSLHTSHCNSVPAVLESGLRLP